MDLSSTTIVRTDSPDGHQAADAIRQRVARDLETERDIQLLKDVLQRTRAVRAMLHDWDHELAYKFAAPYAEVERRLAFLLLRREEQRDLS